MKYYHIMLIVLLWFIGIVFSATYDPDVQYNLLIADNVYCTLEEYRGDTFKQIRKISNYDFKQIQDVVVKGGIVFIIPYYDSTVEAYDESTFAWLFTVKSWKNDTKWPVRLQLVNDNELAVILDTDIIGETGAVTVFDITDAYNQEDATELTTINIAIHDMAQDSSTTDIWVVDSDANTIAKWNSQGVTQGQILDASSFPASSNFQWIEYYQGDFYLSTYLASDNNTIWKINPTTLDITEVVTVDIIISSFLFDSAANKILIFGVTEISDYEITYGVTYYDGVGYWFNMGTQVLSSFTPEDGYALGLVTGSSWGPSDTVYVADYSQVWQYEKDGSYYAALTAYSAFITPTGLAADSSDDQYVYVPKLTEGRSMTTLMYFDLKTFDFDPNLYAVGSSAYPEADGSIAAINGIAVDDNGNIYVASWLGSKRFDANGGASFNFTSLRSQAGDVYYAPSGNIWFTYGEYAIAEWNAWGRDADLVTGFVINRLVVTEDTIYAAGTDRISIISLANFPVVDNTVMAPSDVGAIWDIEIGPDGSLYVLSQGGVARLDPENDLAFVDFVTPARPSSPGSSITFVKAYCDCPASQCTYGVCHKKLNVGMIVGIVVGVVGFLAIGAVAGFFIWKKRSHFKKNSEHSEKGSVLMEENTGSKQTQKEDAPRPKSRSSLKSFDSHWEIDFKELELGENIGSGSFGTVYKAVYRNSDCVVKQLKESENKTAMDNFLKEAHTVIRVKPHKNICSLFGVCTNPEYPTCIVMEFVNGGSLQTLLADEKIELNIKNAIKIFKDVVSGMSHLHHEGLLHCDLACRNLLVSLEKGNDFTVKISDFGLARFSESGTYNASINSVFPVRWSAPEVLRGSKLSKASDVWSFGVLMWEVIQGTIPYLPMNNQEVIEFVCVKKQVLPPPTRIENLPPEIYECMKSCWAYSAGNRPSFDGIFQSLKELENELWGTTQANSTTTISQNINPTGTYGNRLEASPSQEQTTQTQPQATETRYESFMEDAEQAPFYATKGVF